MNCYAIRTLSDRKFVGSIYADDCHTVPSPDPDDPTTLTAFDVDGHSVAYIWSDRLSWEMDQHSRRKI